MQILVFLILSFLFSFCYSRVLFFEDFNDKNYKLRWFNSIDNLDKQGTFTFGYGPMRFNQGDGQGLKTEDDYRYYLLSSKMKQKYSNRNKTLIIQYQVIFPSLMECGGAYIKVLGSEFEPTTFSSKTSYKIMFGPDVCGFAFEDRELKAILNYKGKYYKINQVMRFHMSHIPQLFTFIIRPDNTYEIHVNMSIVAKGSIGKDFRMIRPKMIRDKNARKPVNWDDNEVIIDSFYRRPPHKKHELFIINPEYYLNSSSFKFEKDLPYIVNPDYMKPWHPPILKNPKYQGEWIPPLINNPNYNVDDNFYLQTNLGGVAIDVWQMSSGVIYDNILITDNEKFAKKFAKDRWKDIIDAALETENHAKPYNQSVGLVEREASDQNQNDKHHDQIDSTGQKSCYNHVEALKNTVFGPTKDQLQIISDQRNRRLMKMKEDLYSQLSPVPKYSFFDPRYFSDIQEHIDNFDLKKRLKEIDSRRLTNTQKYVTENGLTNF